MPAHQGSKLVKIHVHEGGVEDGRGQNLILNSQN